MMDAATADAPRRNSRREGLPEPTIGGRLWNTRAGRSTRRFLGIVRAVVLNRICVFCGSSLGTDPRHRNAASAVGELLADRGIEIVYGGGHVGLMGLLADGALAKGGRVHGVIPQRLLDREVGHEGLTSLSVVPGMHERKREMADRADAFIALPGGYGTLEELFECITWTQLGYHRKPVGLLNVAGFYDRLLAFLDHAVEQGFIGAIHRGLLHASADPEALLDALSTSVPPSAEKWIIDP
jgi:uncharacterized protein (TIGR00730 family)